MEEGLEEYKAKKNKYWIANDLYPERDCQSSDSCSCSSYEYLLLLYLVAAPTIVATGVLPGTTFGMTMSCCCSP